MVLPAEVRVLRSSLSGASRVTDTHYVLLRMSIKSTTNGLATRETVCEWEGGDVR